MSSRQCRWAGLDLGPLAYESSTSCLLRFAWRNACDERTLRDLFSLKRIKFELDYSALQEQTSWLFPSGEQAAFKMEHDRNREHWMTEAFRYCPLCLESGYHSDLFQCSAVNCCPFHGIALSERCHCCGCPLPKVSDAKQLYSRPYECSRCGQPFCGVEPSLDAHLDFRACFSNVQATFEPYYRWWQQLRNRRIEANSMRPPACTGRQTHWCSIPEFIRAIACKGVEAPACVQVSPYPDSEVVVLSWHCCISLGHTADFFNSKLSRRARIATGQAVYRSTLARLGRWVAAGEGWTHAQLEAESQSFRVEQANMYSVRFLAFITLRCQLECQFNRSNEFDLWPQRQAQLEDSSHSDWVTYNGRTSRLAWRAYFLAVYASWHARIERISCVSLEVLWESAGGHLSHIFSRNQVMSRVGETWHQSHVFNADEAWFDGAVAFLRIKGMPLSPWDDSGTYE